MSLTSEKVETLISEVGDNCSLKWWYQKGGGSESDFLTDLAPYIRLAWDDGYAQGEADGYEDGSNIGWINGYDEGSRNYDYID